MAVTLVGEVINTCDSDTGFNAGGFGSDDAAWEGTAAIGIKASATTVEFYTTSSDGGGAGFPYDFSNAGAESGYHIVMWFNTKTPVDLTTGLTIIAGNGVSRGRWNVIGTELPLTQYEGGWQSRVINPAEPFDTIAAGTWTTTGNPGQLTNVTQVGGGFTTITSIMGSFNNVQIDQFTTGLGLRVDAGTVGTPNTFETVRAADEDGTLYGWWSSTQGAFLGKGKLYIGPSNGTSTSVFTDSAFAVIFADEIVGSGFYELSMGGTNTDVKFSLANITTANTDNDQSRWSLTASPNLKSFNDSNSVFSGAYKLTLNSGCYLNGTSLVDCTQMIQNSGILESISVLDANTGDGQAFLLSNRPDLITGSRFVFSSGYAIELTPEVSGDTFTFTNNIFTGYTGKGGSNLLQNDGPTNAAIYNNSFGPVTINVSNGTSPSIRNGFGATTTVVAAVNLTLANLITGSEIRIYEAGTTTEVDGTENSTSSFVYSFEAGAPNVDIRIFHLDYLPFNILNYTLPTSNTSIPISQIFDRNYSNPI